MNNKKLLKQTEIIFTFRKLDRTLKMILGFCLYIGKWTSEIEFVCLFKYHIWLFINDTMEEIILYH